MLLHHLTTFIVRRFISFSLLWLTAPLSVKLMPSRDSIQIGSSVLLNCSVLGHPVDAIVWEKDHRRISGDSPELDMRLVARDLLRIESIRKEHRGLYTCLASNDHESVQASHQLVIGGKRIVLVPARGSVWTSDFHSQLHFRPEKFELKSGPIIRQTRRIWQAEKLFILTDLSGGFWR